MPINPYQPFPQIQRGMGALTQQAPPQQMPQQMLNYFPQIPQQNWIMPQVQQTQAPPPGAPPPVTNPGGQQLPPQANGQGKRQAIQDWRALKPQWQPGMDQTQWRSSLQDWRALKPGGGRMNQTGMTPDMLAARHADALQRARNPAPPIAPGSPAGTYRAPVAPVRGHKLTWSGGY